MYTASKRSLNHVLRTMNIGLDALLRVILSRIHLLDSRGMDDDIYSFTSSRQTL